MREPRGRSARLWRRKALVGLLLLTLLFPLAAVTGQALPQLPSPPEELGMTPRAGSWSYFTGANRSEPLTERYALVVGHASVCIRPPTDRAVPGYVPPRTALPVNYRLIYLLPAFNTKYK